jgi:DNA-binding MarR family transcriptional regulator
VSSRRKQGPGRGLLLEQLILTGRRLSAATVMFHQTVAARLGLNPTDHKCADFLLTRGPMTAGELATATGLTTGAITGVIDRLEAAGYVRRDDDPRDRRRVVVRAVPAAIQEIGTLFADLAASTAALSERYSDAELAVILDFMDRSREALHEATVKLREKAGADGRRPHKRSRPR